MADRPPNRPSLWGMMQGFVIIGVGLAIGVASPNKALGITGIPVVGYGLAQMLWSFLGGREPLTPYIGPTYARRVPEGEVRIKQEWG